MVTIETEHGTFEGETLKDASKKARQAAQAAKKQAVKDEADRKIAYLRAKEHGYEIYRVREEKREMRRAWRLCPPGYKYASTTVTSDNNLAGELYDTAVWHGEHGKAESRHNGYRIFGTVENGAGFPMAVFLVCNTTNRVEAYAVGIEGTQIVFADLPGISSTDFRSVEEPDEAAENVEGNDVSQL